MDWQFNLRSLQRSELLRLRSLMTPHQALRFQLATGNWKILEPFPQIMLLREAELMSFDCNPEELSFHHRRHHGVRNLWSSIDNPQEKIVWVRRQLEVFCCTEKTFNPTLAMFKTIYLTPDVLRITECKVNIRFVARLKLLLCGHVTELLITNSNVRTDAAMTALCIGFPSWAHLIVFNSTLPQHWVDAFIKTKKSNLVYMSFTGSFEKLFSNVDMSKFHLLLTSQKNKRLYCIFVINDDTNRAIIETTLNQYFSKHFITVSSDDENVAFKVKQDLNFSVCYALRNNV